MEELVKKGQSLVKEIADLANRYNELYDTGRAKHKDELAEISMDITIKRGELIATVDALIDLGMVE